MSAWLWCTFVSHIFHDRAGYCTANHMCYPLSRAAAMASFFYTLCYRSQLCYTELHFISKFSACVLAVSGSLGGMSWN